MMSNLQLMQNQSLPISIVEGTSQVLMSMNFYQHRVKECKVISIVLIIKTNNKMSCLSCQLCSFTISTQTKTQLIVYPSSTTYRNGNPLTDRISKIKRNNKSIGKAIFKKEESKGGEEQKIAETMDTVSKIVSMPSSQFVLQDVVVGGGSQLGSGLREVDSKLIHQVENKENISQNLCEPVCTDGNRLTNKNEGKSSDFKDFKLKISQSGIMQARNSIVQSKSLHISHVNMLSPHSSNVSNFTEKNLAAILLEKQNQQLRDELARLKQKEKQLLAEQYRVRDKNNRELGHLKKRSQQLEAKSNIRKKQLQELKSMLKVVQKSRESVTVPYSQSHRSQVISPTASNLGNRTSKVSK